MDIYSRLKDDHGKQRSLSAGLADTSGDTAERRRLFDELAREVEAHAGAEEQVFYAELMAHEEGQEQARHSVTEHKEAADLLEELGQTDMSSSAWLAKFKTLKEELEHHVKEEEQEVFALAQRLIVKERAVALAKAFEAAKQQRLAG